MTSAVCISAMESNSRESAISAEKKSLEPRAAAAAAGSRARADVTRGILPSEEEVYVCIVEENEF